MKTIQTPRVLARSSVYKTLNKRKMVMKAFITSQFSYCPLVRAFHSKRLGKKINVLHESALSITYGEKSSSFNELLEKDNNFSIYHKNVQALATEMYKVSSNMSPAILNDTFASRDTPYNLRNPVRFKMQKDCLVCNGTETQYHMKYSILYHLVILNKK